MADLNAREIALLVPLVVLMVVLGVMPQPFLNKSEPATTYLLETIERKRLAALQEAERRQQTAQATFDAERFTVFEASQGLLVKWDAALPSWTGGDTGGRLKNAENILKKPDFPQDGSSTPSSFGHSSCPGGEPPGCSN